MQVELCEISSLNENKINVFKPQGLSIILIKTSEGIYALQNKCGHMGVPLDNGEIKENTIICIVHRISFNLEDGTVHNRPWEDCESIQTYPVTLKEDKVYIEIKGE